MRKDQRGQGLVETALAVPILLLLVLGSMQVASLLWLRVRLQHAAECAARAYTVWQVEDPSQALKKAQAAAWLALRPQPKGLQLQVGYHAGITAPGDGAPHPETHHLTVMARLPALPGLGFWRQEFLLGAEADILSETPFGRGPTKPSS